MELNQPRPLETLIRWLGRPAYGGVFAIASAPNVIGFIHESAYDSSNRNDWVAWHCTPDAQRTGNYCYAVLTNPSAGEWSLINVCTVHGRTDQLNPLQ